MSNPLNRQNCNSTRINFVVRPQPDRSIRAPAFFICSLPFLATFCPDILAISQIQAFWITMARILPNTYHSNRTGVMSWNAPFQNPSGSFFWPQV